MSEWHYVRRMRDLRLLPKAHLHLHLDGPMRRASTKYLGSG
jgi:hypothetical protein